MPNSSLRQHARLATAAVAALVVFASFGTSASAGGWAVGSIDAIPDAAVGQTTEVGFTILQHGVTPVDLADDVGLEIVLTDGTVEFFAATGAGATGRYVSAVTFPSTPGEYTWNLRMGGFGTSDLGTVDVISTHGADAGAWSWAMARWVTLGLAVVLAAVAVADLTRARRRVLATQP
jgi:hypothetical protein